MGKCSPGFVGGIGHHESRRLYEKCASSPKFLCLAKRFNAVLNDNFQSFANEIKVSYRNAASEIYSEFIYLCWRLWSPCFSLFCWIKTVAWKLIMEPNSFIVPCIHELSLNSKCLIEKKIFSLFSWQPKLISQAQLTSCSRDRRKHRK